MESHSLRRCLVLLPLALVAGCPVAGANGGPESAAAPGFFAATIVNETDEPVEVEVAPSRLIVDCSGATRLDDVLRAGSFATKTVRTDLAKGAELVLPDTPTGAFPANDCPAYRVRARAKSGASIDRVVLFPPAWEATEHRRRLVLRPQGGLELATTATYRAPTISHTREGGLPACREALPSRLPRWMAPLPDPKVAWTISEQRAHAGGCLDLDLTSGDGAGATATFWAVCAPDGAWPFSRGEVIHIRPGHQLHSVMYPVPDGLGTMEPKVPDHVDAIHIERASPPLLRMDLVRNGVPGGSVSMDGAACVAVRDGCDGIWVEGPARMGPAPMHFPAEATSTFASRDGTEETLVPAEYRWLVAVAESCSPSSGSAMYPGVWSGHVSIHRPLKAVAK